MKKMSKLLSGAMALALVACMGTTAFAASDTEITENPGTGSVEVAINATLPKEAETVYKVELDYEPISFTYSETTPAKWDPDQHTLSKTDAKWDKKSADIVLKNHSNAVVYYKAELSGDYATANNGVTLSLVGGEANSMAADTETTHNESADVTLTVNVTGTPTAAISETAAATVTVTLGTSSL